MDMGRWYPLVSLAGAFAIAAIAADGVRRWGGVPGESAAEFGPVGAVPSPFAFATVVATVTTVTFIPFVVSRPNEPRSIVRRTIGRVAVVSVALSAVGPLLASSFPGAATVSVTAIVMTAFLVGWFLLCRRWDCDGNTLVVTTDPLLASDVAAALPDRPCGFVSPPMHLESPSSATDADRPEGQHRSAPSSHPDEQLVADDDSERDGERDRPRSDGGRRSTNAPRRGDVGGADSPPIASTDGTDSADRSVSRTRTIDVARNALIEADSIDGVSSIDGIPRLGGFVRQADVLSAHDIDTVALAVHAADRNEFFGTLERCRRRDISVLVPDEHAEHVLVAETVGDGLCRVALQPWSWYSRLCKRLFDVAVAAIGLLILSPLVLLVTIAITLDSRGPVLYGQSRTSVFGRHFHLMKFRTMRPENADTTPVDDAEDDRVTRIGRLLRPTHVDEIPQLVSILVGDMSVVGPRAVWTEEERVLEHEVPGWRARWLVKPGLTGLAQIRGATSVEGERKLAADMEYVRERTLRLDVQIVLAQIRIVLTETWSLVRDGGRS